MHADHVKVVDHVAGVARKVGPDCAARACIQAAIESFSPTGSTVQSFGAGIDSSRKQVSRCAPTPTRRDIELCDELCCEGLRIFVLIYTFQGGQRNS